MPPSEFVVDARGDPAHFQILSRANESYVAAAAAIAPQPSHVLDRAFRIERARSRAGRWDYRLATV